MKNEPLNPLFVLCNYERLSAVPSHHWPEFTSAHLKGESAVVEIVIPPELHWFEGHFPGQPVLPGVVQTHWAALIASAMFDIPADFSGLTRLKFKTPLLPSQAVSLQLINNPTRSLINYRYHHDGTDFSSGTLHFGEPVL